MLESNVVPNESYKTQFIIYFKPHESESDKLYQQFYVVSKRILL